MPNSCLTVALVSTQRHWYGGEGQLLLLADGLRRRGHQVRILARRHGKPAQRMRDEGFAVSEFAGAGRNPVALWQIRRHLRRIAPDVLQYGDAHALTAAGLASCGLGIAARIAVRNVAWHIRAPWRFRAFADRVLCVSPAVAEVCRADGLPADSLRVVFAGADPRQAGAGDRRRGRLAAGVDPAQRMLLVVASLTENKGHAFLLDALPAVLDRHPQTCLVLTGEGPSKEPLQLQARRLGVEGRVRFVGYRPDVPDLVQAADLVVLPSLAEGLPVCLLDAMLAGVPIVTSAVGGIPDLVGSQNSQSEPVAWMVPARDSPALSAAIIEALDNPRQCALRAQRARDRAERTFTADCMVEATLAVYRELLPRA
jgi:glycosyltransferase involved in cell wall biosynthesis